MVRLCLIYCLTIMTNNWKAKFTWTYLKTDATKNIILFCSCLVSFTSLLLASGFYTGSSNALNNTHHNLIDSSSFKISKKEKISNGESPISLVRTMRPAADELSFLDEYVSSYVVGNDYQRLFPGNYRLFDGDKSISETTFSPIYSFQQLSGNRELIIEGKIPSQEDFSSIVINEKMANLLNSNSLSLIGHPLWLEIATKVSFQEEGGLFVEDVFLFQGELIIRAVFKELAFLNVPKIFYSYRALEKHLDSYMLEDISDFRNVPTSCRTLLTLLDDNHYLANYALNLFALDDKSRSSIINLHSALQKSESSLVIESEALIVSQTYVELVKAAFYSMLVFVVIAFVGTCSIMAIGSYSNYVSKKKESAILSCLGASKQSLRSIFLGQSFFVSFSAAFFSIVFSILIQRIINPLFENYFLSKTMINIPFRIFMGWSYSLIVMLFGVALVISVIFTSLPLTFYKKLSLADELREN